MLNSLSSLMEELDAEDIMVVECHTTKRKAMCTEVGRMVGFDPRKFDTQAELCTALIHEEGHFTSGAFYRPYSPYQLKAQAEERAQRAAIRKHIPLAELQELTKKDLAPWELAEHFNVTTDYIWRALHYYQDVLGVSF